jgi:hypothetical protein
VIASHHGRNPLARRERPPSRTAREVPVALSSGLLAGAQWPLYATPPLRHETNPTMPQVRDFD